MSTAQHRFGTVLVLVVLGNLLVSSWSVTPKPSQDRPSRRKSLQNNLFGGSVAAVYDLLDRVLPSPGPDDHNSRQSVLSSSHFLLQLCSDMDEKHTPKDLNENRSSIAARECSCQSQSSTSAKHGWFCMEQEKERKKSEISDGNNDNRIVVMASSVSELSYGIGYYLRYYCNVTLGWDRVGGSVRNVTLPSGNWPVLNQPIQKHRRVPWSYLMNVCTHSYSLVWYDWKDWEAFLDWASLMGINNLLACKSYFEGNSAGASRLAHVSFIFSVAYCSDGPRRNSIQGVPKTRLTR